MDRLDHAEVAKRLLDHLAHMAGPYSTAPTLIGSASDIGHQSCQLLQLVDDRVYAPKPDAPFRYECRSVTELSSIPKINCDWSGVQPTILSDVLIAPKGI
jgi:hypothetical protein